MKWISKQLLIGSKCYFILPHHTQHMSRILLWSELQYLSLRYCYEKNNVIVLRKKSQHTWWVTQHNDNASVITDYDHAASFMGRGVVDSPLKEVAEFYKDIQSTFLWDHLLVVSTCSSLLFRCMYIITWQPSVYFQYACMCRMLDMWGSYQSLVHTQTTLVWTNSTR